MGIGGRRGGEVVGQTGHHGLDLGGAAHRDEEPELVNADIGELPGFCPVRRVEIEPPLMTVGGAPEHGQPQLAVLEVEAVLTASMRCQRDSRPRAGLPSRTSQRPWTCSSPSAGRRMAPPGTSQRSAESTNAVGTRSFSRRRSSFQVTRKRNSRAGQRGVDMVSTTTRLAPEPRTVRVTVRTGPDSITDGRPAGLNRPTTLR